jgi:hypothetical protein
MQGVDLVVGEGFMPFINYTLPWILESIKFLESMKLFIIRMSRLAVINSAITEG